MIYKKPYAFLIKNFKLIHLIISALIFYLIYKSNRLYLFIIKFIKNNGIAEFASINNNMILIVFSFLIIIALNLIIYFLLKHKDKPRKLYLGEILISIVSFFIFIYLNKNIKLFGISLINQSTIRLLRDLSLINTILLVVSFIQIFVRGIGFNIKKFNFDKDLYSLEINEKDNEEVEASIDIDKDKLIRQSGKIKREFKYYYLENKFFLNIIICFIIIFLFILTLNFYNKNKTVGEGKVFSTDNFNIIVSDSFYSTRKRNKENEEYLVLQVKLNSDKKDYVLNINDLVLYIDGVSYLPTKKSYNYFPDAGIGYYDDVLTNKYTEYILIYKIPVIIESNKCIIKYKNSNKKIKIKPTSWEKEIGEIK